MPSHDLSLLAAAALAVGLLAGFTAGQERLVNPSFETPGEDGLPLGWSLEVGAVNGQGRSASSVERDGSRAHDGDGCLRLAGAAENVVWRCATQCAARWSRRWRHSHRRRPRRRCCSS